MIQESWSPTSWKQKLAAQQVAYPDPNAYRRSLDELAQLPPLVTSWEVESLRSQLAEAAEGRRFLLQGGDCSETFSECCAEIITRKLKILLQMSLVLLYGSKERVIRVGRFAGQYAKPRSSESETRDNVTLLSFRGENINRSEFTIQSRTPDPSLLLRGYERSALTLNFVRSLVEGGFADLHHPEYWDLDFVKHSGMADEYRTIATAISDSLHFMETCTNIPTSQLNRVDFFTSHEGLQLDIEQAQTRQVPRRTGWYNLSTHLPWIGDRTRALDGAHVEYFRGIENPIGVKIGPSIETDELCDLIKILNPDNVPGRLTLIHRFGAGKIEDNLPQLVEAVHRSGSTVLWCCDPMHGNTIATSSGIKTRSFGDILRELELAFRIHQGCGSILGGVHFELTGENVTECIGGARGLSEADLHTAYASPVDPRLNYEQAMEMAFSIARLMRAQV
jgi:3-deoxy-7-phosphoheptulonate synthase